MRGERGPQPIWKHLLLISGQAEHRGVGAAAVAHYRPVDERAGLVTLRDFAAVGATDDVSIKKINFLAF